MISSVSSSKEVPISSNKSAKNPSLRRSLSRIESLCERSFDFAVEEGAPADGFPRVDGNGVSAFPRPGVRDLLEPPFKSDLLDCCDCNIRAILRLARAKCPAALKETLLSLGGAAEASGLNASLSFGLGGFCAKLYGYRNLRAIFWNSITLTPSRSSSISYCARSSGRAKQTSASFASSFFARVCIIPMVMSSCGFARHPKCATL
mmetsp:Transcript_44995/g.75070  ORF Transcript_44995/g.75070 Transcript_44995/m.75070 type:complete len:205 (-) Transcript_44995:666-1280(-)